MLYSKNRKYSFDLYYKFYFHPNNSFANYGNIISYKVNFYFQEYGVIMIIHPIGGAGIPRHCPGAVVG